MAHSLYIHFGGEKRQAELETGKTILDYARQLDVPVASRCGGLGTCGECTVVIENGISVLNNKTPFEKNLKPDERLACRAEIVNTDSDIHIRILTFGSLQIISEDIQKEIELSPAVRIKDNTVTFKDNKIDDYKGNILGIASDIGTTTIVLHLMDLETGKTTATGAFENPQRKIDGDNVIARIDYDSNYPGKLQKELISYINRQISKMPCRPDEIYEMVIVGNTTMRDLFFQLDVQSIGNAPYKSITEKNESTCLSKKAKVLGLKINSNAQVYGAPLIGSHVGADTAAVCLSSGMFDNYDKTEIAVDIGTNTEIVLKHNNKMMALSCAAGSALEKTPGIEGAIQAVSIDASGINWITIGDKEPVGICGSGIVDLFAEALRTGLMNSKGELKGKKGLEITEEIAVREDYTRNDFLLGKAAVSLGIKTLLEFMHVRIDEIDVVYLAGSYGNFIDPENAMEIGLIPSVSISRVMQIGNAAAAGAKEMLLSEKRRKLAEKKVSEIEHIALESLPDYQNRLIDELVYKRIE